MVASEASPVLGRRRSSRLATRRFEIALVISGVVASALIVANLGGPLFAVFIVATWFMLPGWVVARITPVRSSIALLFVTIIASAVITATFSLSMAWTGWWAPQGTAVVLLIAAASFVFFTPGMCRTPEPLSSETEAENRRTRSDYLPPVLIALIAIVLWLVSLRFTTTTGLGKWGLLPAFPVTWYLAVAVILALCIWGLCSQKRFSPRLMGTVTGTLIVMLYGSANLVESMPRLVWTYKHIAVTNYIDAVGRVDPSIDIYNRWPGFFAVSAFIGHISGYRDAVSYATWAEPLFALIDAALVFGIARALSRSSRMAWIATLVFSLCNWVNQNYYSPQAFAYTLYLAMCLIVMTYLRGTPRSWVSVLENPIKKLFTRLERRQSRRIRDETAAVEPAQNRWSLTEEQRTRRLQIAGIVAVLVLQAVITASHQLTPYLAVLGLLPLIVAGYIRPRLLGLGLLAIPLLYLVPNFDYIESKYGLFSGFDLFANVAYTPQGAAHVTDAAIAGGHLATALSAITVLLAAAGWIRHLQQGNTRTTIMVAWLAVAPVLALFGQSYGGEGRLRVFLFGLPWYSIGVAWLFWSKSRYSRRLLLGLSAAFTAMAVLFVIVYFQPEADRVVPEREFQAAQWLDARVASDDGAVQIVGNFPLFVGPHYRDYNDYVSGQTVLSLPLGDNPNKITAQSIEKYLKLADIPRVYLIFSDAQTEYAHNHEMVNDGVLKKIELGVQNDTSFHKVFDNSTVRIYELPIKSSS